MTPERETTVTEWWCRHPDGEMFRWPGEERAREHVAETSRVRRAGRACALVRRDVISTDVPVGEER